MRTVTNEQQRLRSELLQEQVARKDKESLQWLLDSSQGRWFLMRLFDRCRLTGEIFTGNSTTFRNEGMRKVAILYQDDIAALGLPAVRLKQLAELEYIQAQQEAWDFLEREEDR